MLRYFFFFFATVFFTVFFTAVFFLGADFFTGMNNHSLTFIEIHL
jgi:hypothetical protein